MARKGVGPGQDVFQTALVEQSSPDRIVRMVQEKVVFDEDVPGLEERLPVLAEKDEGIVLFAGPVHENIAAKTNVSRDVRRAPRVLDHDEGMPPVRPGASAAGIIVEENAVLDDNIRNGIDVEMFVPAAIGLVEEDAAGKNDVPGMVVDLDEVVFIRIVDDAVLETEAVRIFRRHLDQVIGFRRAGAAKFQALEYDV